MLTTSKQFTKVITLFMMMVFTLFMCLPTYTYANEGEVCETEKETARIAAAQSKAAAQNYANMTNQYIACQEGFFQACITEAVLAALGVDALAGIYQGIHDDILAKNWSGAFAKLTTKLSLWTAFALASVAFASCASNDSHCQSYANNVANALFALNAQDSNLNNKMETLRQCLQSHGLL